MNKTIQYSIRNQEENYLNRKNGIKTALELAQVQILALKYFPNSAFKNPSICVFKSTPTCIFE